VIEAFTTGKDGQNWHLYARHCSDRIPEVHEPADKTSPAANSPVRSDTTGASQLVLEDTEANMNEDLERILSKDASWYRLLLRSAMFMSVALILFTYLVYIFSLGLKLPEIFSPCSGKTLPGLGWLPLFIPLRMIIVILFLLHLESTTHIYPETSVHVVTAKGLVILLTFNGLILDALIFWSAEIAVYILDACMGLYGVLVIYYMLFGGHGLRVNMLNMVSPIRLLWPQRARA
jgi:hypothetical protein